MLLVVVGCCSISGCKSLIHELRPHRLWRWNYADAPSQNALFSVPDRLDAKFVDSIENTKVDKHSMNHD